MRLSKLHIAGFKSFHDRAELGFDTGVTAIVGPNGCGKSNVVDAITWVLGEQSAKSLRGERMEDVIFNGSDARKPSATAEVRLKLSDVAQAGAHQMLPAAIVPVTSEAVEGGEPTLVAGPALLTGEELLDDQPLITRDVEIGRRLYRSGESEYLIDGEVCRLRDIHDLLMDSGLGVKAYAVIEQGKIGQILSSRPAERRSLIEEAAGITKYKSRRRAAELKLEAAQQNLTRIDDIIFEVEKQRGALKRQAARARRYKRLREELRRWEHVQFARRYEALARDIQSAEARLEDARAREAGAAAHVAELETALEAVRLGLTEAEAESTTAREQAHARELSIGRHQQQIQFDRHQIDDLARQADAFESEASDLEGRRAPAHHAIESQRAAVLVARQSLEDARLRVQDRETDYSRALSAVQAVEQEADTTRAAVMSANTTLAALRQARDNAAAVRDRVAAERERYEIEARDLASEADRIKGDEQAARDALTNARQALDTALASRHGAETALAAGRADRERVSATLGSRERELAAKGARLRSLEEVELNRATFGDAARFLLAEAAGALRQHGAVADHLDVDRSFERAVDALLGDLLQHVLVDGADDVAQARALLSERNAGRCGFIVLEEAGTGDHVPADAGHVAVPPGARALNSVVRATGPHAHAVRRLIGPALIVGTYDEARALARTVSVPVATMAGEVLRGSWLVQAGSRQDVRGILESRAETLSLRDDVNAAQSDIRAQSAELAEIVVGITQGTTLLASLVGDVHAREKGIVGIEARVAGAGEDLTRVLRRLDLVRTECRRAAEETDATERRREEAVAAIVAHETGQRDAEARLSGVLERLHAARDEAEARMRLVTESRSEQAGLVERVHGLDVEVRRLEEAAHDLDHRIASRRAEIARTEIRRGDLRTSIAETEQRLDDDVSALELLKSDMRTVDERVAQLREQFGTRDLAIRGARHALDAVRADVLQSEVARATATADLTHLGNLCVEAVALSLDEVVIDVARMEAAGELVAPARRLAAASAPEADDDEADAESAPDASTSDEGVSLTPDQVVADLRKKVDRLGPVNMMAIEQFDELETRHSFLTTQRKDLLDSIAQTGEAIRKIDKTTRERFAEAFEAINRHFEKTFTTLFGGGRAGLTLIDQENDHESGIDIHAQPPGKRLQNVQLLSGGEKALTAMGLMFAIFKYRPSPFCLLDEIDAPLDDANIGRFVEMLQSMQSHTQFILITHNRKTMEIANRLYGVTMEEPGVSKLISLQLN